MSKLQFSATVTGNVNGESISISGRGEIDEGLGRTIGSYELLALPKGFSPGLLTACLLTGYPNATHTPAGLVNPFKGRSYSYRRTLYFADGVELTYKADCELRGITLESHFRLAGRVPEVVLPEAFVQEIEEVWSSLSGDTLGGTFDASWSESDGRQFAAQATSAYGVSAMGAPTGARRRLQLDARTEGKTFHLRQDSSLLA